MPLKAINFDIPKKQGMVVRHIKRKLHVLVLFSWKRVITYSDTPHTPQHSVFAFTTFPRHFASSMSAVLGLMLECCNFRHWYYYKLYFDFAKSPNY